MPTAREMKLATRNIPSSISESGTTARAMTTAPSTAPMPFAVDANAPARMKIRHIIMMFGSPMPRA